MSLEAALKEEFLAGRQLGIEQGVLLVQAVMRAIIDGRDNNPLPPEIILGSIQTCLNQVKESNK
jgi:4'-phosphopantetheinyl transferase EntD